MYHFWHRFRQDKLALVGSVLVLALALVAIFAPAIAPCDPSQQNIAQRHVPPGAGHIFGTDQFGRDVFSRLLAGTRISLGISLFAAACALGLGTVLGAWAGYRGGWHDSALMRLIDLLLSFPLLYLLVALFALFGSNLPILLVVLAVTLWGDIARLVRSQVLALKEADFVKAAHLLGFSRRRILFRHILPNALAPVFAAAALRVADILLIESGLSFLGLGVQPPAVSWGGIIRDGRDVLVTAWWVATFPGLAIALTAMSFHWIGDGLRRALA
jgi:peptide/nickel transport system permease protein